ncbi:MAG: hypothetical protein JXA15_00100 [Spirochaetales bacterium]|nr:hypothetical protein [Spirochaetales bacterium]
MSASPASFLRRSILVLAVLGSVLGLSSCASGIAYRNAARELERGDYAAAALQAATSLYHDPKNEKALDLLVRAHPLATESLERAVDEAMESVERRRWETVADSLATLHAVNDAIQRLPPLYRKGSKTPVGFELRYDRELLASARAAAADNRYAEAGELMRPGDRRSFRDAYESFRLADYYAPGYRDALARAEEARSLGSDRVAVLPFGTGLFSFEARSAADALYGAFVSNLVAAARRKTFLQVVDRGGVEALLAERELSLGDLADPRIRADMTGIYGASVLAIGQVLALEAKYPSIVGVTEIYKVTVDEVIPGSTPVDGVYPTWKAEKAAVVTTFTKSASLSATVEYRAVDAASSVVVDAASVTEKLSDSWSWAVLTGDMAAVPASVQPLLLLSERDIKGPELMIGELASLVGARMAASLAARFE